MAGRLPAFVFNVHSRFQMGKLHKEHSWCDWFFFFFFLTVCAYPHHFWANRVCISAGCKRQIMSPCHNESSFDLVNPLKENWRTPWGVPQATLRKLLLSYKWPSNHHKVAATNLKRRNDLFWPCYPHILPILRTLISVEGYFYSSNLIRKHEKLELVTMQV